MPVTRSIDHVKSQATVADKPIAPALVALKPILNSLDASSENTRDFSKVDNIYYPNGGIQRESYRTKENKRVPAHHWAVYDLIRKIPVGSVSTYKDVCIMLGEGSPRSVGSALRNNPFAPFIPCHRVIASNRSVGGFCGEWEKNKQETGKRKKVVGHCDWKVKMLKLEGVEFNEKGYLIDPEAVLWKA